MKEYIPFNINDYVRISLTDHGRELLREKHRQFWSFHPNPPEFSLPEEDKSGRSKWQLWTLMETFGQDISMTSPNCFDLWIEFEVDKLQ